MHQIIDLFLEVAELMLLIGSLEHDLCKPRDDDDESTGHAVSLSDLEERG